MRLCFDATRFGCGLDGAIELAHEHGLSAVEYSFAPFPLKGKKGSAIDAKERRHLLSLAEQGKQLNVEVACLNLDFCLNPLDKGSLKEFALMLLKTARVADNVGCRKVSFSVAPTSNDDWQKTVTENILAVQEELENKEIIFLLRLSTPMIFRDQSLKYWRATEPQEWREFLSGDANIGLSFSPADCLWLGLDYLRILAPLISAIEHVEAHDVEISRELLNDSGMYGPLWWRYRTPGKGQVDWRQLIEALKLYDFKGTFSLHLDDEFINNDKEELENSLTGSLKFITPLLRG